MPYQKNLGLLTLPSRHKIISEPFAVRVDGCILYRGFFAAKNRSKHFVGIVKESMPVEEAIEWYTKKLVILKHGEREVYLSPFDLSDLENEILGYIELRLKYLLESKWRDEKNG